MNGPHSRDWDSFKARIPFLVENFQGMCFAAFATRAAIMEIARCTIDEADRIQARAHDDFCMLMIEVEQAKRRLGPAPATR